MNRRSFFTALAACYAAVRGRPRTIDLSRFVADGVPEEPADTEFPTVTITGYEPLNIPFTDAAFLESRRFRVAGTVRITSR